MKASNQTSTSRLPRKINAPDLTAFIDLGFLLVTFFMYSLYLAKPTAIKLNMPEEKIICEPMGCHMLNNYTTLILGKDNRLFWHHEDLHDLSASNLIETDYSQTGLRNTIATLKKQSVSDSIFTFIIKPTNESTYKNTVDVLDEMSISGIKLYTIVDIQPEELIAYNEKVSSKNLALNLVTNQQKK